MIRCLIVDEEPHAHLVLLNYINRTEGLRLCGQCCHIDEIEGVLEANTIDLLFLDIHLPDKSGLSILRLTDYNVKTILTTAFSDFALAAFDRGVLDYLLKPFSYERFLQGINRYREIFGAPTIIRTVEMKVAGKKMSFELQDVVYLQSWGNYIKLFTTTDSFICNSTTREAERTLPRDHFVRIHKSYLVNINFIEKYDVDYIILKNQSYLPVGITYRRVLLGLL